MEKENFENLIKLVTGKNLSVTSNFIELEKEYNVFLDNEFNFTFKTPKKIDSLLSSFINQYCNKAKIVEQKYLDMFKFKRLNMYMRHHCKTKFSLMNDIKENFNTTDFIREYCKYGFYSTEYGIGIFVQFLTDKSFTLMEKFLTNKNIPFVLEYSEKEFVLRFKIKLNRDIHFMLLNEFKTV